MPFQSPKQRRFLFKFHPDIARRWAEEEKMAKNTGLKTAAMRSRVKKTGWFGGRSNALGHGGRAAQLKAKGVPGGVIGNLARKANAAPGERNYHGRRRGR